MIVIGFLPNLEIAKMTFIGVVDGVASAYDGVFPHLIKLRMFCLVGVGFLAASEFEFSSIVKKTEAMNVVQFFIVCTTLVWLAENERSDGTSTLNTHTLNTHPICEDVRPTANVSETEWYSINEEPLFNNTFMLYEECGRRTLAAATTSSIYWPGEVTTEFVELILIHAVVFLAFLISETRTKKTPDFTGLSLTMFVACVSIKTTYGWVRDDGSHVDRKFVVFAISSIVVVYFLGETLNVVYGSACALCEFIQFKYWLRRLRWICPRLKHAFVLLLARMCGGSAFLIALLYVAYYRNTALRVRTKWSMRVVILIMVTVDVYDYQHWNRRFFPTTTATTNEQHLRLFTMMPIPLACRDPTTNTIKYPSEDKVPFDNLFLTFTDHLWATYHVELPNFILMTVGGPIQPGMVGYSLQKIYARFGMRKPAPDTELERKLFDAITGSSLCARIEFEDDVSDTDGVFHVEHFRRVYLSYTTNKSETPALEYGTFQCNVDFKSKRAYACTFQGYGIDGGDGQGRLLHVSPSDALASAAGIVTGDIHPEIRSFTNYMLNTDVKTSHPYTRRMSIISVKSNAMAAEAPPTMEAIKSLGLSTYTTTNITTLFGDPLPTTPNQQHFDTRRLQRLASLGARYAKFVVPLRQWFVKNYASYDEEFNFDEQSVTDPHAIFEGMLLYSLDHGAVSLLFSVDDAFEDSPDFAGVVEMSYIAVNSFIDNQPWRLVGDVSAKNSPIKLYQELYKYAATIDVEYANHLETAIVK